MLNLSSSLGFGIRISVNINFGKTYMYKHYTNLTIIYQKFIHCFTVSTRFASNVLECLKNLRTIKIKFIITVSQTTVNRDQGTCKGRNVDLF